MQNEVFDFADTQNRQDYEKLSYGKFAYKRVQRLRRKGRRRGIEVPPLTYELTKPEKPRIAFWVIAVISAILFVGILVGIGFLYNELIKTSSDLSGIGEFLKVVFDPAVLTASFGWSAIPGILLAVVYLLIVLLFALPIIAAICFFRFVRDAFYMAKCSKEEFAKGSIVSSRMLGIAAVIVTATVIFVILLSYTAAATAKLYLGLIFGGLVVVLGGMFVLIAAEKTKCAKWFKGLDEDKKQNYLQHESALRRIKRRLNTERDFFNNI